MAVKDLNDALERSEAALREVREALTAAGS